jgi:non-lysosomal glucosylceramidase
MLAFPLGGVGAGSISLGGRGQLRDWEIFNRADKGKSPNYAFACIWARVGESASVARVLEARLAPPYEGPSGLGSANAPGLPRLTSCTFIGEYPFASIAFEDAKLPVKVTLEAFTPFIPHDTEDSGLPIAVLRYRVTNPARASASVSIAFSIDNPVGSEGRTNQFRQGAGLAGLVMRNPFLATADPLAGSFVLAALDDGAAKITTLRGWRGGTRWRVGPLQFWDDFSADGELGPEVPVRDVVGSICLGRRIAPGTMASYTFLLAWHFPNRTPERCGWRAPKGEERTPIGNHYATRFADAWETAAYAAHRLPDLEKRCRAFTAAMREATLPPVVKEAAMANLSTLVSPTCFRTADGAFHGFEGCFNRGGCCFGNCTHVWNYETATHHLFPELARSLRQSAFGFCTDEEGRQDFRELLPSGKEHYGIAAADGQMGQIMKLFLDWKLSGDTQWLRRLWPSAKRALEFAWVSGGWDADRDGVMEGVQHNTYDVEFYGPNPLCGVWYLGALRAAEEMARALGDGVSAAEYRRLFASGSRWIDSNLFNGEYYIQQVRGVPRERIARGLMSGMGAADPERPDFQVGEGCLVDQLVGQYFAHVAGLGRLLDRSHIRAALRSIYKYNYKRSLNEHESVQRVYALNDEAALVICDYSRGKRPEIPFPYYAEVMTGFEYSAAVLMLYEGMVREGVELIANIRRRYDGDRRNPWNEAECGHHYARAMASWSAVLALGGFHYQAAERNVEVQPRIAADEFRSPWFTATGWGTFSQVGQRVSVSVLAGKLPVRSVQIKLPAGESASVMLAGKSVQHKFRRGKQASLFHFRDEIEVMEGEELTLTA